MLYALNPSSASRSPFLARDHPRHWWNDELKMMNVESISVGAIRKACTGRAGNLYAVNPSSDPRSPFLVRDHPDSDHAFIEDLREFICLRLDRVDPYKESKEYCLQQEKAARLHEKLLEMLPEEGRAALMEYGEALGAAHYLEVAMLAERAFLDGVRLILRAVNSFEC